MKTTAATYDNLPNIGFGLGFGALALGVAVAATATGRSIGFGVAPVFGAEAVHIQAGVQLIAGCVPIILALVWTMASPVSEAATRLRPLLTAIIALCFTVGVLTIVLNWAIEMGHLADHAALLPALLSVAVAVLYVVFLSALPTVSNVAVASQIVLRGSALWLVGYSLLRLTVVSGRVLLDEPRFVWFFDTAIVEMAILGFVLASVLGLVVGAFASVGDPRTMMRSLPVQLQAWHATVFLWTALRVWCVRYPGGVQKLVLALVGIIMLVLLATIIAETVVLQRLLIPTMHASRRRDGLSLAGIGLASMGFAALLLVWTAMMAAGLNGIPPTQLLSALLSAVNVAMITTVALGVFLAVSSDCERVIQMRELLTAAAFTAAAGGLGAALLWPMTIVVERSLRGPILALLWLGLGGLLLAMAWMVRSYVSSGEASHEAM